MAAIFLRIGLWPAHFDHNGRGRATWPIFYCYAIKNYRWEKTFFWTGPDSHGNLCPSAALSAAITQCLNCLYKIKLQSNSIEFMERVGGTITVKPQCMLVYGRSADWGDEELKSLRILNSAYHQLHIITYDQLLLRAKQLLGVETTICDDDEEWPF